jgi:hypothetical protein
MSLINEALKRAEAEKAGKALPNPPPPLLAEKETAPSQQAASWRKRVPLLPILVGVVVLAGGYWLYRALGGRPEPSPQPVAANPILPPATPAHRPAPAPAKPKVKPPSPTDLPIRLVTDVLTNYVLLARPSAESAVVISAGQPATAPAVASAGGSGTAQGKPGPAQAKPKPTPRIDETKYKLTAVLRHSDGASAVINGSVVEVGQSINGAKVVTVNQFGVELELDGVRFVVRM